MKKLTTLAIAFSLLFLISCDSERIEPTPTPVQAPVATPISPDGVTTDDSDTTTPPLVFSATGADAFLDKLRKSPSRKTITSISDLPFIAEKGTRVWIYPYQLRYQNGDPVSLPFEIEILELYEPGEMILFNAPTTSGGELLVSGGQFRIRAFKDGEQLVYSPYGGTYLVNVPVLEWMPGTMNLFEGGVEDEPADWQLMATAQDNIGIDTMEMQPMIISTQEQYLLNLDRMGWINCDYFYNYPGERTSLFFKAISSNNLQGIRIYVHFPGINSVMGVNGSSSGQVPVGDYAEIIAVSSTDDGATAYYDYQEITIQKDMEILLDMKEVSEEDFQTLLDGL